MMMHFRDRVESALLAIGVAPCAERAAFSLSFNKRRRGGRNKGEDAVEISLRPRHKKIRQ